ncbi:tetratricopeptide repeat protein [candidate division WOR-3 bacterium]|nr:tetratricopeptide repeat protein [candidate division WOR-3 bacterium]
MEIVSIVITLIAIIATVVFGYFQIIVPFVKKEVRLSKEFPFVESTDIPVKRRRKKKKPGRRWLIPVTAVAVVIIAIILFRVLLLQAAELPTKPIAIMTFKNLTGEEKYDYLCEAIPNLLITNLEQSEHLQVMTWERMHDLLEQLDKEDLKMIDEQTGFELCRMDDVNTIVIGSFTKAGNVFVTDVKILDVSTKKLLRTTSSKGEGVVSILKVQVDHLSKDIAKNISLFERTVAPTEMEVIEVTTGSMEAYNYFIRGKIEHDRFCYGEAVRFLEKAVELDSTFASAHYYLGMVYFCLRDVKASKEAYQKAKILSGKVTEKERLYIEAEYAQMIEKDYEKWYRILSRLAKKYPKEKQAHMLLGYYYFAIERSSEKAMEEHNKALELDPNYGSALNRMAHQYALTGDYTKAIEYYRRYAAASPGDANPFDSMGDLYFRMGQLDEAIAQYQEALFVDPDFYFTCGKIAYIYALREEYDEAMKWLDRLIAIAPSSGIRASGFCQKAFYGHLLGNSDKALTDLAAADDLLKPIEYQFGMVFVYWIKAWIYFDQGKFELSRDSHKNCYATLSTMPYNVVFFNWYLGLIELKQEHFDSTRIRLATITSLLPDVTVLKDHAQFLYDLLYAEVLFAQDSLEKSITVFKGSSKFEVETPPDEIFDATHIPYDKDIQARAYLKKATLKGPLRNMKNLLTQIPINGGGVSFVPPGTMN